MQNIPCVGITQADADAIRASSAPRKDGDGNALYYTGKMTIGHKTGVSVNLSEDCVYTMSSFSSWVSPAT